MFVLTANPDYEQLSRSQPVLGAFPFEIGRGFPVPPDFKGKSPGNEVDEIDEIVDRAHRVGKQKEERTEPSSLD